MRRRERDIVRAMAGEAHAALHQQKEPAAALKQFEELRARLAAQGSASAFLLWQMAIAADQVGDLLQAMALIDEAVELDPLCPNVGRSYDVIVSRIRAVLDDGSRDDADSSTPLLYDALVRRGAADDNCHLVMARFLRRADRRLEAMRILEAVVTVNEGCVEAWALLAEVAHEHGDADLASRAAAGATVAQFPRASRSRNLV